MLKTGDLARGPQERFSLLQKEKLESIFESGI
jgi:hypothetical protein